MENQSDAIKTQIEEAVATVKSELKTEQENSVAEIREKVLEKDILIRKSHLWGFLVAVVSLLVANWWAVLGYVSSQSFKDAKEKVAGYKLEAKASLTRIQKVQSQLESGGDIRFRNLVVEGKVSATAFQVPGHPHRKKFVEIGRDDQGNGYVKIFGNSNIGAVEIYPKHTTPEILMDSGQGRRRTITNQIGT